MDIAARWPGHGNAAGPLSGLGSRCVVSVEMVIRASIDENLVSHEFADDLGGFLRVLDHRIVPDARK